VLTPKQAAVVRRAQRRSADPQAFHDYVADQVAGVRATDAEVRRIIDEATIMARGWKDRGDEAGRN